MMASAPSVATRRALLVACACSVLFGVYLRAQQLGFPAALTFDEHHFVENARNYLAGKPDWNDHPPLGKLLMAAAIWLLGDNAQAWRLPSLLCGLLSIVLAFVAGRSLFRDPLAAALAAAYVALDGFLIAYSRTALLDGMLTCCALFALALLAGTRAVGMPRIVLAGAVAGLASSIKLSGITLALPIVLSALAMPATRSRQLLTLGLSALAGALIFDLQYALGLALSGAAANPLSVARAALALVEHHAALTQMTHPLTSHWYAWFLPFRPITLRYDLVDGAAVRALTTLGNPALWWSSAALVLGTLLWLTYAVTRELRRDAGLALRLEPLWAWLLPSTCWLAFLSPWVLSARDSYVYHYLPCYSIGLVLLAGASARAFERWPRACLLAFLLVAEVSVFYAPVWGQLPLSEQAFGWRLFLPCWR